MERVGDYFLICTCILFLIAAGSMCFGGLYYVISEITKDKEDKNSDFNKPLFITMVIAIVILAIISIALKSFVVLAISNAIQCIFVLVMLYMISKDNK